MKSGRQRFKFSKRKAISHKQNQKSPENQNDQKKQI